MSKIQNKSNPNSEGKPRKARYVLITQCLQNDFFLNKDCSLCLPKQEVSRLLVGSDPDKKCGTIEEKDGKFILPDGYPEKGPMGRLLHEAIGKRLEATPPSDNPEDILHVINIRDWHKADAKYDIERQIYGAHCEKDSEGAKYVKGLEEYLDPEGKSNSKERFFRKGNVRIYHVESKSVFDFGAGFKSELEQCLDLLFYEENLDFVKSISSIPKNLEEHQEEDCPAKIYIGVIGVYSDIKIVTLLMGLKSQYPVSNLAVSDSFTASSSFERHITAMDFSDKVLDVEIIHGLNDFVRFLGGKPEISNSEALLCGDSYRDFSSYRLDKQLVLANRSRMFGEYHELTDRRSRDLYEKVDRVMDALFRFGVFFLCLAAAGVVINLLYPLFKDGQVIQGGWASTGITGVIGAAQLISRSFITKPVSERYRNLMNLVSLRIILENHSLRSALARFHLTTPETLRNNFNDDEDSKKADRQLKVLEREIKLLSDMESKTYDALRDLVTLPEDSDETLQNGLDADQQRTSESSQGNQQE